jgi:hypothetical protein
MDPERPAGRSTSESSAPAITSGQLVAFYLFDIAETVNLQAIPALVGGQAVAARLVPKASMPAYVRYDNPPLSFDGDLIGASRIDGFRTRVRLYDYGVISLALTREFSGDWSELVAAGQALIESDELERHAERLCRGVVTRLQPALAGLRDEYLTEDYLVFALHELERPMSADELVAGHGDEIALMLRGERQKLSEQEKAAILRHRISYLDNDLVVPTWNAAFVYDTVAGAQATLEILEFANSQLLEFRYYDQLLDGQLASIYGHLQRPRWLEQWIGARYTRAARQVHSLFIDVNELTDRTENTLKFVGDIYAARLFGLVAERLGLETWKANVQGKLRTLDDIYRFAVEHTSMSRGTFLEATIVLILVLELVLILVGVMQ